MSEQGAPPAEAPSPLAPEPGQSPWDLSGTPEELRPYVEEHLKKVEGGITKRFQEAAEFKGRMEPLSGLADIEGLADVPPEELQELMQFRELAQDPDQFREWVAAVAEELGIGGEQAPEENAEVEPPAWAQSLMQELDQLKGNQQQTEMQQREAQALEQIDNQLQALKQEHGEFDEDAVCQLAMAYNDEDAVAKGFADYQRLTGAAQAQLVDGKESVPGGRPLSGGSADTAPPAVNGFGEAKTLARQRFADAR